MNAIARDALSNKEKEAKELMKKAKALTAPSLLELRFKPDWEAAAPMLDKAALLYKQAGNVDKAVEAYERAAMAQERLGSQWHAAKHYEVIAELLRREEGGSGAAAAAVDGGGSRKPSKEVAKYYKLAADLYVECGKPPTAGECLTRGARALEDSDPEEAIKMYYDALDVYESNDKESYGMDTFRHATSYLIRQERWADAVEVQMRFGAAAEKTGARHSQNKAYLGAVVTWLWAGDADAAWHTFQDAMAVDSFAASEEAFAADALFEAYKSKDEAAITSLVASKPLFKQLDHQVARLATRLPSASSRVRRMGRKLKKMMEAPLEGEGDGEGGEEGEGGDEGLL